MTNRNGHYSIRYGSATIEFTAQFRDRKRLAIHVYPDKSVEVVAPKGKSIDDILQRVRKRASWILRQQAHFERFHPLPTARLYVSGETHLYLGRQYRLKVRKRQAESVKLVGRYLHVFTSDPCSTDRTRRLLESWYRVHAVAMFHRRLGISLERVRNLRIEEPEIIVRRMKTRWGSCTQGGNLVLNTELVKAPLNCIDYVIMHELCHLKIRIHSPAFYRLMTRCMPDWERRKERLEYVILSAPVEKIVDSSVHRSILTRFHDYRWGSTL